MRGSYKSWKWYAAGIPAVLVVGFVCWLLFADVADPGEQLQRAAFYGQRERVVRILEAHPEVVNYRWKVPSTSASNLNGVERAISEVKTFVASLRHTTQLKAWEKSGYTPLDLAVRENHPDIVAILLDHKADAAIGDANNFTGLHLAVQTGEIEVVRIYIGHHADLESQDSGGNTPLCWAALGQWPGITELLLANGAKVDGRATNGVGMTPLQWAAQVDSVKVAEVLLKHGASVELVNGLGMTPLAVARGRSNKAMIDFLEEHGAKK